MDGFSSNKTASSSRESAENLDDFFGATAAGHRSMHSAVVSGGVGGFAGEEKRVLDRSGERLLRAIRADLAVAVSATGKGQAGDTCANDNYVFNNGPEFADER